MVGNTTTPQEWAFIGPQLAVLNVVGKLGQPQSMCGATILIKRLMLTKPSKLSDGYTHVWPGIPVPKDKLLWDDQDSFGFEYGSSVLGVNRSTEIWWRNRKTDDQ